MSPSTKAMPATPECDKMSEVKDKSQVVGEFLEWLQQEGVHLCRWRDDMTATERCYGLRRDGRHASPLALDDSNCEEGVVERKVEGRDGLKVMPGETCPRCNGEGHVEFPVTAQYVPEFMSIERVLAKFFEIDLDKVEQERRALLEHLRST